MEYKDLLRSLHENALFRRFLDEHLRARIPKIPPFNPSSDNTDQWKYSTGLNEGYRMALRDLGVKDA